MSDSHLVAPVTLATPIQEVQQHDAMTTGQSASHPSATKQQNELSSESRDQVSGDDALHNVTSRPAQTTRRGSVLSRVVSSVRGRNDNNDDNDDDDNNSDSESFHEMRATLSRKQSEADGFNLEKEMKAIAGRASEAGSMGRRLDVAWKNLCIRGVGADVVYADDVGSILNPLTKRNDSQRAAAAAAKLASAESAGPSPSEKRPIPSPSSSSSATAAAAENSSQQTLSNQSVPPPILPPLGKNEKFLIQGFTGCLKSGEMALVLGRPGAGCTSFMKAITNIRQGYAGVDGEVTYGTLGPKEAKQYSGQIIFVDENETHYPDLTVAQTLKFALKMKTPSDVARPEGMSREEYENNYYDLLTKTFAIEHTADTKVGDSAVRGVSGGERKRVTLAEALATRAPVLCIDQGSRGLDASNALELVKTVRIFTDFTKQTSFMTLYQAGNDIYDIFDKVLVIAAGHCIYWGPLKGARPYFEELGFVVSPGANLSDYLTAVTVATERVIADDKKGQVPNTPEEFAKIYLNSQTRVDMVKEYEELMADEELRRKRTEEFKESVQIEKQKRVGQNSVYTTTLWTQIAAATRRQYALTWNDKSSLGIKYGGLIIQAVILGSLFYKLSDDSNGLFTKSGVLFLIILVNALLGLGEVVSSFRGRAILAKHKSMALYRPAALILAQVAVDIPIVFGQVTVFLLPIYFMCQLRQTAGAFFTLWIITYVTTHALLGLFRLIGFAFPSFDGAGAVSGFILGLNIITTGYLIPASQFKPWIGWWRYLNPLYYALEAAFGNEFKGTELACVAPSLIPYGQGYPTSGNGVTCTVQGATAGSTEFSGEAYLNAAYGWSVSHLWRNFGIVIVWWVAYVFFTCIAVERLQAAGSAKSYLLFRRPTKAQEKAEAVQDSEKGPVAAGGKENAPVQSGEDMAIDKSDTLFVWKNLNYTVPVKGGHRQLLHEVQGIVTPGTLCALMGSSGAGKTTLLDVLALRKSEGKVEGDILVDGRPLGPSFQRTCGYVSQMDIHEPTQSIREAFLFSARLRLPQGTPESEISAYVEKVIDILELSELADAVIGVPGAGLSIEQRKRCTIGVELVAKPKLLFLDEPTSGLDGQSAFNILRFLRKLADAGQSMLVTVHQPSALLFEQFDSLLLLAKGGKVVYNGPLGEHSSTMKAYFASKGVEAPEHCNPAEFMIDVVSGRSKQRDWAEIWRESDEYKEVSRRVDQVNEEARNKPPSFVEDGRYFAASLPRQIKLVLQRQNSAVLRTPSYSFGRAGLVIGSSFVTGVSFLQMNQDVLSVQNRLFAVFNAMFVAPGLFNLIQPFYISARTLYGTREKPSKMYGWFPWVFAMIVTEIPWLLMSALLSFTVFYLITFPVGLMTSPSHAGLFFAEEILYFLWVAGFAQTIAALCPNPESAALLNSVPLGLFASFSGVLVPYSSIPVWWRYWVYYINPWTYILGAKVSFVERGVPIYCTAEQFSQLQAPNGQTCGEYLSNFLATAAGYVEDENATGTCNYCKYQSGDQYLSTVNLGNSVDGPRNIGITALWCIAFWSFTALITWRKSRK